MKLLTRLAAVAALFIACVAPVATTAQEAGPDWTGTVTVDRDRFNRAVTEYLIREDLLGNRTTINGDVNNHSTTECNDKGSCVSNTANNINGSNIVEARASENGSVLVNAGADGRNSRQEANATTVTGPGAMIAPQAGATTYIGNGG